MVRESREVLGHNGTNLWLLTLVLVATFTSIAFSHGSMNYLRDKMEDPFTNWVSINKATNDSLFGKFREALFDDGNKMKYGYQSVLLDQFNYYNIAGVDTGSIHYLSARFFESINTPLMSAILSEDNVVEGCNIDTCLIDDKTMGFVITLDAARRLGYDEKHLPTYILYIHGLNMEEVTRHAVDSLGIDLVQGEFTPISMPILAVVRRLPNNVDLVSASFFYEQQHGGPTFPFDPVFHESNYLHNLAYYVSDAVGAESFDNYVSTLIPDSLSMNITDESQKYISMKPWKTGTVRYLGFDNEELPVEFYNNIAKAINSHFDCDEVRRVHLFDTENHPAERGSFISVAFSSLKHIREFETFAKENGIQLEMSQVASKENFDAVTTMAGILSAAMVIFSIVCIIMFMVNMLQSYFQKVKRNLGTFKAFGMNSDELIRVYVIILVAIVSSGVILALIITWAIQGILPVIGIEKDGFNYLSLWNTTTYIATAVIFVSTILTVIVVMTRMLSQTPGDLIYDRN